MESGTASPGISVAERLRRNRKITITTRQMVSTSVNFTSSMESLDLPRSIERDLQLDGGRNRFAQLGQQLADALGHLDRVGARLLLDGQNDAAHAVVPARDFVVLHVVDDIAELFQADRNAVAVRHDQRPVCRRVRSIGPFDIMVNAWLSPFSLPVGRLVLACCDRVLHVVDADAARGELDRDPPAPARRISARRKPAPAKRR